MADSWRKINLRHGQGHLMKIDVRWWQVWTHPSPMRRHMRLSLPWPWTNPIKVIKVIKRNICVRILKVRYRLSNPIVFDSNHMLISHHQEYFGDFHIRDLKSKVKMQFYWLGSDEHFCPKASWALKQPFRRYWPFCTFATLKWSHQGHPGSHFLRLSRTGWPQSTIV